MHDIWAFLLQTLSASGVAVVLLLVKYLLRDKLSPRWQFSIWGVLGIVLLLPAGLLGRYTLLDWPLYIETIKFQLLGYTPLTHVAAPIPLLPTAAPHSIADWLFILYAAGVVLFLLRYILSYIHLRLTLRRSAPPGERTLSQIQDVAQQYALPTCAAVMVPGLQSAFICGVIHPVLALPAQQETDRKVLLHELMHLKHKDVAWGWVICLFRCIHWCNPLLWYCADLAGNDMEQRCDQRVLERLEGEERRDYGRILLSMANEKYARTPGTSSAANGGKNIRKRIESIVRFKLYPAGMALVSVCIALVLTVPVVFGTNGQNERMALFNGISYSSTPKVFSAARLTSCTTPAAAMDCYAKATIKESAVLRLMCTTDARQEQLLRDAQEPNSFHWDSGLPEQVDYNSGYYIHDVRVHSDTDMEALLVLLTPWTDIAALDDGASVKMMRLLTQNIHVYEDGGRWIVEPTGPFEVRDVVQENIAWGCRALPATTYRAAAADFEIELSFQKVFTMDNWTQTTGNDAMSQMFGPQQSYSFLPRPDAYFDIASSTVQASFTYVGDESKKSDLHHFAIAYAPWPEGEERPELTQPDGTNSTGASNTGCNFESMTLEPGWPSHQELGGSGNSGAFDSFTMNIPQRYALNLYLNGEPTAQLTLTADGEVAQ